MFKRLIPAFGYSCDGLKAAWHGEAAFRTEVLAACVLVPLAFYLAPGYLQLILMVGSLLLVLAVELINTAIEAAIDRHGEERHPLAKQAKDAGSAAVLIMLINAAFVWLAVLFA